MFLALAIVHAACGRDDVARPPTRGSAVRTVHDDAPAKTVDARRFPDLATALAATIPADARVIGFGELHSRTDRADVRSSLARFTADALPGLAPALSDLVIETWLVDPKGACGKQATEVTARVEITMRRPPATKSEVAALAESARAAGVQPRAMTIACDDYARIAPAGKDLDVEAMLTLTTKELGRLVIAAITARDAEPTHRKWIAVYGGALHNDRFPAKGVAEWSYAAAVDAASHDHFLEIDLVVPELAEVDAASQQQPWFPLVARAEPTGVAVWQRGERSFVIVLARGVKAS